MTDQAKEPENRVTLWVDGTLHEGWTAAEVALDLDQLCGGFTLELTREWLKDGRVERLDIPAGAACRLDIDGSTVVTGYVDKAGTRHDGNSHTVSASGRDKAGDLVDCSADIREFHGQKLEAIVAALARPFGVTVKAVTDTGEPFARFAPNAGDSVSECIERLCRQRGVLAWSDGLGAVLIGRVVAGPPVATLARGTHILAAGFDDDHSQRFSEITTKGSREGDDDTDGEATAHGEGRARDAGIKRHRPLLLVPETQGTPQGLGDRAAWEVNHRRAKGRRAILTVRGWAHGGGLWRPGQTVTLADDWLPASGDWLIGSVRLRKGAQGTLAELTCYPPGAFDVLAEPEKGKGDDDD